MFIFPISALPHLAVSSSTPPPPSSPLPMKIKSEPISPPRDHHGGGGGGSSGNGNITCGSLPPSSSASSVMHLGSNSNIGMAASPHSLNLSHTHHNLPRPNSTGHLTPNSGMFDTFRSSLLNHSTNLLFEIVVNFKLTNNHHSLRFLPITNW